jgi:preprotein translocase subunit SecY
LEDWGTKIESNYVRFTLVYRFGAHVTLPGIDATQLNSLAGKPKVVLAPF